MARRALSWLLLPAFLALVFALGSVLPLAQAERIPTAGITQSSDDHLARASLPHQGGDLAAIFAPWNDDDPDDIALFSIIKVAAPTGTFGLGRRIFEAVSRQRILSAAFPRGPPSA